MLISPDNLITNMRNRLHTFPFIAKVALTLDDRFIHHARGHIIVMEKVAIQEALIVPHVLVRLEPAI